MAIDDKTDEWAWKTWSNFFAEKEPTRDEIVNRIAEDVDAYIPPEIMQKQKS